MDDTIYDLCIIGAGIAGLSLWKFLKENSYKGSVAILEAGNLDYSIDNQEEYKGEIVGNFPHAPLEIFRARQFGGTSNLWGAAILKFDKYEFNKSPRKNFSRWPISHEELDEHYDNALRMLGVEPANYKNITENTRLSESGDIIVRDFYTLTPPTNFKNLFFAEVKKDPSTRLILNGAFFGFDYEPSDKLNGCRIIKYKLNNSEQYIKAKRYVVAMGGLETTRALLNSKATFSKNINYIKNIGAGYSPHINLHHGQVVLNKNSGINFHQTANKTHLTTPFISLPYEILHKTNILNFKCTVEPAASITPEMLKVNSLINSGSVSASPTISEKLLSYLPGGRLVRKLNSIANSQFGDLNFAFEQSLASQSQIKLSERIGKSGYPLIRLENNISDYDKNGVLDAYKHLANIFIKHNLGRIHFDWTGRTMFDSLIGASHHIGGAKMALSSEAGIVDRHLKIYNTNDIYVLSSATFPTPSYANPTLTIMALSSRLSRILIK